MAERLNQTLYDKAFPSLLSRSLPSNYWPEAVKYSTYLRNRLPVQTLETDSKEARTPHMIVHHKLTNEINHAKIFGCDVWYRSGSQKKFRAFQDEKGALGSFVGFNSRHVIRIRDKQTGRLVRATVVLFDELNSRTLQATDGCKSKRQRLENESDTEPENDEDDRPLRFARFDDTPI